MLRKRASNIDLSDGARRVEPLGVDHLCDRRTDGRIDSLADSNSACT